MIGCIIFCFIFVLLVITITAIFVHRAKKEVMKEFNIDYSKTKWIIWEEEEENDEYCVM